MSARARRHAPLAALLVALACALVGFVPHPDHAPTRAFAAAPHLVGPARLHPDGKVDPDGLVDVPPARFRLGGPDGPSRHVRPPRGHAPASLRAWSGVRQLDGG